MSLPARRAAEFAGSRGLAAGAIAPEALLGDFLDEMDRGLSGTGGSLAMIPSFIAVDRPVPRDRPVIVMDAGGTHLRVAVVAFPSGGRPRIGGFARHDMPGTRGEVSRAEFFRRLADSLLPVIREADAIGCCFSYAVDMSPERDGRLLHWTKEVRAPEVVGNYIGRSLLAALRDAGYERNITLLNDTIATLLAGRAAGEAGRYGGYVGFILGTGTNTAYVESNRNITKRADLDPAGCQAVNVESGNFGRCPRTDIDEAFDLATSNPGRYVFEKMISGAYLGGLCLQTLRSAADDGVFTADGKSRVLSLAALSTKEADDFLGDPLREGPLRMPGLGGEDREAVATLLSAVFGRAALLTAVNLGAAIVKSGAGRDAARPACATVDGSTFYKTRGFKALVEEHLGRLLRPRGLHAELVRVENAPIIGAAVAGLTCQPATQAAATGPAPSARPRPAPGPAACSTDPWRPAPSTCG